MKKYFAVLILAMALGVYANNNVVKSGTYENLLTNGKLELYAGSFPAKWRYVGNAVEYQANGGFADGGRFIFKGKGKSFLIRQDWSFTLNAGEKYYLKAKIRTKNFKASKAVVLVFNNGWKKSFEMPIPQGSCDWSAIEKIFDGMDSNSGYYSVAIQIAGVKSGELEVSDIAVEPATARAFELSTAYLKEIPVPELVVLGRREDIPASNAVLCCRYFGDKTIKKVSWIIKVFKRSLGSMRVRLPMFSAPMKKPLWISTKSILYNLSSMPLYNFRETLFLLNVFLSSEIIKLLSLLIALIKFRTNSFKIFLHFSKLEL